MLIIRYAVIGQHGLEAALHPDDRVVHQVPVRVASRPISPPWGPIRFRSAPRTYDAPPCGPPARVVPDRPTKSRKNTHPKSTTALFREQARDGGFPRAVRDAGLAQGCAPSIRVFTSTPMGANSSSPAHLTRTSAPRGCIVRVDELAKSRKIPTRNGLPPALVSRPAAHVFVPPLLLPAPVLASEHAIK